MQLWHCDALLAQHQPNITFLPLAADDYQVSRWSMTVISAGPCCNSCAQDMTWSVICLHNACVHDCFWVQSIHMQCVHKIMCQKPAYLRLESFICNSAQGATAGWLQTCIDLLQIILQLLVIRSSGQCLYVQTILLKLWLTDGPARLEAVSTCKQHFIIASGHATLIALRKQKLHDAPDYK